MVTNNLNNARIVAIGVFTWVHLKAVKETTQFSSVTSRLDTEQFGLVLSAAPWTVL
jgi:hypothetical protein